MDGGDGSRGSIRYRATRGVSFVLYNPVNYTDPTGHCIGPLLAVCIAIAPYVPAVIIGVGAILSAGAISGDSRRYEPPAGTIDPGLQFLGGLAAMEQGVNMLPTTPSQAQQPAQLKFGNQVHNGLENDYQQQFSLDEQTYIDSDKAFVDPFTKKVFRPDNVNHLTGEVVEYKPNTYNQGGLLAQANNQAQNYVNRLNQMFGDMRELDGLPKYWYNIRFYNPEDYKN
jgi:hypothetical protein